MNCANDCFAFIIPGIPKPAGSKRAFITKSKKVVIVDTSGTNGRQWRTIVQDVALQNLREANITPPLFPMGVPILLCVSYLFPRPKSHFTSKGELKSGAPLYHIVRPDLLKLTRAIEDALTGICWHDDAQIAAEVILKQYTTSSPFVDIRMAAIGNDSTIQELWGCRQKD